MPELPEVETVRRTLIPRVVGRRVTAVTVRTPDYVVGLPPDEFRRAVEGRRITGIDRRGKFLIFRLEDDCQFVLHLKMTGQVIWCLPEADLGPVRTRHTHTVFTLDDGHELRFIDPRRFGRIYYPGGDPGDHKLARAMATMAGLGPEPREGGLEWESFQATLARRRARIKPLILEQSFIAGLGNIYADEALFRAGIHPMRRANTLSEDEARALYQAMHEVIHEAIELKGTSMRDYVDGEGRRGDFINQLNVYGRAGEPCPVCGEEVRRLVIGARSAHFCPRCQPPPDGDGD